MTLHWSWSIFDDMRGQSGWHCQWIMFSKDVLLIIIIRVITASPTFPVHISFSGNKGEGEAGKERKTMVSDYLNIKRNQLHDYQQPSVDKLSLLRIFNYQWRMNKTTYIYTSVYITSSYWYVAVPPTPYISDYYQEFGIRLIGTFPINYWITIKFIPIDYGIYKCVFPLK